MNLHDLLQLILPLLAVFIACGNQWVLELFKLRKQKAEVPTDKEVPASNINKSPFEKWNFIFNCIRFLAVLFATVQIFLLVIQSTPLSNKNIFFISYDIGFIVFILVMFFIDKLQNNVISICSSIKKLTVAVSLHQEIKGVSAETAKAIRDILDQLESPKRKKKK